MKAKSITMNTMAKFENPDVESVFLSFPKEERKQLFKLRELIFKTAKATDGVGTIEETLKWNQPSYVTSQTKSGSTIRLGLPKQGGCAIYTNCQTSIISDFKNMFPTEFAYEGNRAIHFNAQSVLPLDKIEFLIRSALTYKLR